MTNRIERTIAAEARAVEEGHRAFLTGSAIRVTSDTQPGLHWLVKATASAADGSPIAFRCEADRWPGTMGHKPMTGEAGTLPCKHAGVAVRRLEREGLARFDAVAGWVITAEAAEIVAARYAQPADPFKGLPR